MKKIITLSALAALATSVNAQQFTCWSTQEGLEALGLTSDATELVEGTTLAEAEGIVFANAYTDNAKIMDISNNGVKSVIVDGVEYALTKGTTGSTNPQGISIETAPTSGWVYQVTVDKDGWLTFFSKLSSNKSYYAFEGDAITGALINYDLGIYVDLGDGEQVYSYSLPGDAELGYFNMSLPDADRYSDGVSLRWPEKIFLGADAKDVKKNGFGYVSFPVYAEAGVYLFSAQGSKANTNGPIFTSQKPSQIVGVIPEKTNTETGEVTPASEIIFRGTSAINDIITESVDVNAPVYNIYGQKVSKDTKGLLISKGVKYFNR